MQWRRELAWHPRDLGWRIAVLFMLGSSLFMIGSFPLYWDLVDDRVLGLTFVVGAVFFTSAAYSTLYQVINADGRGRRYWAWRPADLVWWSALVQFAGTLFFNITTIDAMNQTLTVEQSNRLVWAPDLFGSVAFLVASHLAWLVVCGRLWCARSEDAGWWGASLNYLGSIFFMAAAIASFTLPTSGEPLNVTIINLATFLGAACFFVGAYLLMPPARRAATPTGAST
jgi:hypothetical protein